MASGHWLLISQDVGIFREDEDHFALTGSTLPWPGGDPFLSPSSGYRRLAVSDLKGIGLVRGIVVDPFHSRDV